MLTPAELQELSQRLWPPGMLLHQPLWAVLDGARSDRIHDFLRRSRRAQACVLAGRLHPALARAAPYLLRLEQPDMLTRELLAECWGEAWGILIASDRPLEELRRHLASLFRVRTEDGRSLVFRFYDPRVLRAYLPTCIPAELERFFGPVAAVLIEGNAQAEILRFTARGGPEALAAP